MFLVFEFIKQKSRVKLTMAKGLDPRKFSMTQAAYTELIDQLIVNLLDGNATIQPSKIYRIREDILKDVYRFQVNYLLFFWNILDNSNQNVARFTFVNLISSASSIKTKVAKYQARILLRI